MAKPVAAYRPHGRGQDMAQVAFHKLDAGHCFHALGIAVSAVFPGKGDARLVDSQDAGVSNGGPADVGAEILDGPPAVAEALEMNAPVFLPNAGINNRQAGVFREPEQLV